jgi:chromosome segregation ATPase
VKRLLLYIVKKLDYVPLRSHVWREFQQRLADSEARVAAPASERSELLVQALERQRDELTAQLAACRDEMARADSSGRIAALEAENRDLRRHLHDLEAYLKHTRGEGARYYL